jgi:hypothetical protein
MKKLPFALSALLLASAAAAQSSVPVATLPLGNLDVEGNSSAAAAFVHSKGRHQSILQPFAVGSDKGTVVIQSLFVRPEGGQKIPAHRRTWEIVLSSKGAAIQKPGATSFEANHGTDRLVFVSRVAFNLPATNASASPQPWAMEFKGSRPFVVLQGEGLVVDVLALGQSYDQAGFEVDAVEDGLDKGTASVVGTGCPSNFDLYTNVFYYEGASADWFMYGFTRGSGDIAICWLGLTPLAAQLPGRPGCSIYTLPLLFHPLAVLTSSPDGYTGFGGMYSWGRIPGGLGGATLYAQIAAIDPQGLIKLSHARKFRFGTGRLATFGCQSIHGFGANFDADTSAPSSGLQPSAVIYGMR